MRPFQLRVNCSVLQFGHSSPSTNILHRLQAFFLVMVYFFAFFSLGSGAGASCLVFSSLIHSSFPSPTCLMVRPIFGLVRSLNETAIMRALQESPILRVRLESRPVSTLSFAKLTKSSIVCEMWIMPSMGPRVRNAPKSAMSLIFPTTTSWSSGLNVRSSKCVS